MRVFVFVRRMPHSIVLRKIRSGMRWVNHRNLVFWFLLVRLRAWGQGSGTSASVGRLVGFPWV